MCAEMRSPVRSHADDHAERVGTRPRCDWEPPVWWWVAAEADPAPADRVECTNKQLPSSIHVNLCSAASTPTIGQRIAKRYPTEMTAIRAVKPTFRCLCPHVPAPGGQLNCDCPVSVDTAQCGERQHTDMATKAPGMISKSYGTTATNCRGHSEPVHLAANNSRNSSCIVGREMT